MKITAIVCGRKDQCSEYLARVALSAASKEGAQTVLVNLMDLNIKPCINCGACVRKYNDVGFKGSCPLDGDDLQWLDEHMVTSDGLLFVAPMFFKAAPSPYKAFCDRVGPSHDVSCLKEAHDMRIKAGVESDIDERWFRSRAAAYIGHGGSDWTFLSFPSLTLPTISLGLTIVDYICFDWNAELFVDDARIARVAKLGAHLTNMAARMQEDMSYIGNEGVCAWCHNDVFRFAHGLDEIHCTLCGAPGKLSQGNDGRINVVMGEESKRVSHIFEYGRNKHMRDVKNNVIRRKNLDQGEVRRRIQ